MMSSLWGETVLLWVSIVIPAAGPPLNCTCCQGCFTVSSRGMNYLWPLINKEKKPLLLWFVVSKQS